MEYKQADEHFIDSIKGDTAGVIIGDRALMCLPDFEYAYDLSAAWKAWTGLDFIFAAWVANKQLPADFLVKFNAANAFGINHFDEVIAQNPKAIDEFKAGKERALGSLVGAVMKKSQGKANPTIVNKILKEKLS